MSDLQVEANENQLPSQHEDSLETAPILDDYS
jgi:hypothetical protein